MEDIDQEDYHTFKMLTTSSDQGHHNFDDPRISTGKDIWDPQEGSTPSC